jgi:hypothetical protein
MHRMTAMRVLGQAGSKEDHGVRAAWEMSVVFWHEVL